jgi:NADH-quinone oxidoreductase subunit J
MFRRNACISFKDFLLMNLALFWFWSISAIFSGSRVITSKNPIMSVFWLVLAFVNTAFLLLLLGLEFLPMLFLIVYVGAIAILFLFVVMLLNIKLVEINENSSRYIPIGFIIGVIFLSQIYSIFSLSFTSFTPDFSYWDFSVIVSMTNIKLLGTLLYTKYWIYFLVSSLILLVALIGAILLCLYHERSVRRQDLFAQVATEYDSTVSSESVSSSYIPLSPNVWKSSKET